MKRRQCCPYCSKYSVQVVSTRKTKNDQIVRRKACFNCNTRWYTIQEPETFIDSDLIQYTQRYRGINEKVKKSGKLMERIQVLDEKSS